MFFYLAPQSTRLGPGAGLDAWGRPRRGHSILLCITKKSTESCGDLFFHSMNHRQFLLGFISGASLLPCPFLHCDLGYLMHLWCKELSCCVTLRGAGHDSVVLLIGCQQRVCICLSFWFLLWLMVSISLERDILPGLRKYLKCITVWTQICYVYSQ